MLTSMYTSRSQKLSVDHSIGGIESGLTFFQFQKVLAMVTGLVQMLCVLKQTNRRTETEANKFTVGKIWM